jgi:hypothetical protein
LVTLTANLVLALNTGGLRSPLIKMSMLNCRIVKLLENYFYNKANLSCSSTFSSLFLGALEKSIDEGLSGLKGSNPIPTALVFW